jgi:hypothetical protein
MASSVVDEGANESEKVMQLNMKEFLPVCVAVFMSSSLYDFVIRTHHFC